VDSDFTRERSSLNISRRWRRLRENRHKRERGGKKEIEGDDDEEREKQSLRLNTGAAGDRQAIEGLREGRLNEGVGQSLKKKKRSKVKGRMGERPIRR
jgi:hypothetical protein